MLQRTQKPNLRIKRSLTSMQDVIKKTNNSTYGIDLKNMVQTVHQTHQSSFHQNTSRIDSNDYDNLHSYRTNNSNSSMKIKKIAFGSNDKQFGLCQEKIKIIDKENKNSNLQQAQIDFNSKYFLGLADKMNLLKKIKSQQRYNKNVKGTIKKEEQSHQSRMIEIKIQIEALESEYKSYQIEIQGLVKFITQLGK